jgi:Domain of unknown function (DUF4160)
VSSYAETGWLDPAAPPEYLSGVSPTVFRARGYRFYFFSREEPRLHIHVQHANGEAKYWLEPRIELAQNYGLRPDQLSDAERLIREHEHDIRDAWHRHFPG